MREPGGFPASPPPQHCYVAQNKEFTERTPQNQEFSPDRAAQAFENKE
jgi:hypothetical protein